jgi:hypothetical protein
LRRGDFEKGADDSAGASLRAIGHHLAKREARLLAQAIEHRFAAEQPFGDTDDHAFIPSSWY